MDDLLTRLRGYNPHDATARALLDEASAEIERLRAAILGYFDACYIHDADPLHVDIDTIAQAEARLRAVAEDQPKSPQQRA